MIAWLTCPACGWDAIKSSGVACFSCADPPDEHPISPACAAEPSWTEGDSGPCPGCGIGLRVSVSDGQAWLTETA